MVQLITDSAADFTPEELEELNIACIPITVIFGEQGYRENVDLSRSQFYDLLLAGKDFPKTAQPSPQLLEELFTEAHACGDEAIYITMSSAISGTYQTACMIRDMLGYAGAYVLDSRNGTGGQRMVAEQAVRLRDAGCTAGEIVAELEQYRSRVRLYACIDTLEYLYRGGRISHTIYKLGTVAQIKPIIQVSEVGTVDVPGKAMGMRRGMEHLCKKLDTNPPDERYPLYVMYTNDRTVAETLARHLREQGYAVPEERIISVGAAIGSHIGPGACGLVYVGKET